MIDVEETFRQFIDLYDNGKYLKTLSFKALSGDMKIEVDFMDLYDYSPEVAEKLLLEDINLNKINNVIKDIMCQYTTSTEKTHISLINLPQEATKGLRKIDFGSIGKLIQIKGVILRASSSEQVLTETTYCCTSTECDYEETRAQNQRWTIRPDICPLCGNRKWNLVTRKSKYRKRQTINLFESWDDGGRDSPQGVRVFLWDDLINTVSPGDRVQIVGIPDVREIEKGDPETKMELYITANSVTPLNREDEGDHFTDEEILDFKEKTKSDILLEDLASCISPSIHGNDVVKQAIILQLAGGVEKRIGIDEKRGTIHLLLTGDAGTGKTTLIKAAAYLSSRGIFTTGMGSTRAGLTASVSKDKEEGWVLDAGAMVLASGGLMAVDEFDKMRPEDRGAMHTALESGVVPINKAGINTVLTAKTSVLAACNPKLGRYNTSETLLKNLSDFPETLLSRFDAIFIFLDEGDIDKDRERAEYVDRTMRNPETTQQKFTEKWMRRFIAYSKTIKPKISEEVGRRIVEYYTGMRQAGRDAANSVAITQRQQEALYRFTEASARIHLREEATLEDAENAITTIGFSLKQVGIDPETGEYDINALYSGIPKTLGDRLRMLPGIVGKIEKSSITGEGCIETELREQLMGLWKLKYHDADRIINMALMENILFRPRSGVIKVV